MVYTVLRGEKEEEEAPLNTYSFPLNFHVITLLIVEICILVQKTYSKVPFSSILKLNIQVVELGRRWSGRCRDKRLGWAVFSCGGSALLIPYLTSSYRFFFSEWETPFSRAHPRAALSPCVAHGQNSRRGSETKFSQSLERSRALRRCWKAQTREASPCPELRPETRTPTAHHFRPDSGSRARPLPPHVNKRSAPATQPA